MKIIEPLADFIEDIIKELDLFTILFVFACSVALGPVFSGLLINVVIQDRTLVE